MKSYDYQGRQRGIALVVSLLFLLVVTIISVTAARNSTISLKMASNMQDQNNSLQSTEAGLFGALALASTADDPFVGTTWMDPFTIANPLTNLNEQNSVAAGVALTAVDRACPRPRSGRGGYSVGTFVCDYYRIDSEHNVASRARTQASLGVVKTVLASN